ncbi:unnamed protein product [Caenorhabditis angaria]|uniref:Methyltransferase FkbM domain-containing protein n=1 Tax=Caenorhabditis angaria TaxID=860376 RepID=A0A9P1N4E4_9PELO|nr:unnamed protein product [Caenorhabditis angaria]
MHPKTKMTVLICLIFSISISLLFYYFNVSSSTKLASKLESEPIKLPPPIVELPNGTHKNLPAKQLIYRGELNSMDGVGYNFSDIDTTPFLKFHELNNLPNCDLSMDKLEPKTTSEKLLKGFHRCVDPIFENQLNPLDARNFSLKICDAIQKCDNIGEYKDVKIEALKNLHEIKWAILPKCKEDNVMVTLGIGHDVNAEVLLYRTLPKTKFYGADPIIEPNLQLYSSFGKFFPFALGDKAGMNRFKVLPNQNQKTRAYTYQDVTTIDLPYFFKNILNLTQIDFLWIDIEGGELTFMDHFHKGKQLDELGISVCQFNIELHPEFWPNGYEITHSFINQILKENRYIFLKPMTTTTGVYRLFFINVEDEKCVRKFLQ